MDWFKDNGIFMPMINDTGRNIFYSAAIQSCVKDKVVVDIGTGTGLLSVLAARAGAKKVISVEQDKTRFEFAKDIIEKLNLNNQIEVIHDDFLNCDIPADVYVSETIGNHLFDENILGIAEHCKKYNGIFIPGQFEITAVAYMPHAIFPVVQIESEAFEFQPDINIDTRFEEIINIEFQKKHPIATTKHKANMICNLFQQYKKMTDLKLTEIYRSTPLVVNLSEPFPSLSITIRKDDIPSNSAMIGLFWKAKFANLTMDITDTIWCIPCKHINSITSDIVISYNTSSNYWMFDYR